MTRRITRIALLVAAFLAAVVTANLLVTHFGPTSTPFVAFGAVAAALIFRDRFADYVNPRSPEGIVAQVALIAAGAALTYAVNRDAAVIAVASVTAFAASELIEGILYIALSRRQWLERAPLSATVGAAVDSVVFITLAFGFSPTLAFLQWVAKVAGAYLWAWVISTAKERRGAVLPRNA